MKKKDSLKEMFKDSILNEDLQPKIKGGATEVDTLSRGRGSHYVGEGGYTTYDEAQVAPDDLVTVYS